MRYMTIGVLLGLTLGVWHAGAGEAATAVQPQAALTLQSLCPVMGGKINRNLYVDYEGQRIYVCCQACVATVRKDPAKYIRQLAAAGITVAKLQTTCPVMGGKVNRGLYVDYEGQRIYVCCQGCIEALKKDAAKYVAAMEKAGIALEAAPGTGATQ